MNYNELLKHPKWQRKRLEIMKRDEFQCRMCFSKKDTLAVHHKTYSDNKKPWEYDDIYLITLCDKCHKFIHTTIKEHSFINLSVITRMNETDLIIIVNYILLMLKQQGKNVTIVNLLQLLSSQIIKEDEI